MIRLFDIIVSALLLIVLAPLMLLIALLIKLDSKGPVLFRQTRVGRNGSLFEMLKFRKMFSNLLSQGPAITSRYDSRLTIVGRWLERTKLDELPQLFNVLAGDMSIVGPRPELEQFTAFYPKKWKVVLTVKPGLIGINQILNRNESEMYPPVCYDKEDFYARKILPAKLDLDIKYIQRASLPYNLYLLLMATFHTLAGTVTRGSIISTARSAYLILAYTLAGLGSIYLAFHLRFPAAIPPDDARALKMSLVLVLIIRPILFLFFGTHKRMFGIFSFEDIRAIFKSTVIGSFLIILALLFLNAREISRLIYMTDLFICFLAICFLAYSELLMAQKNKVLTNRRIRKEVFLEAIVIGLLSFLSIAMAYLFRFGTARFQNEIRQSAGMLISLSMLNPVIYLITFNDVPCRFIYFAKAKMKQAFLIVAFGSLQAVVISVFLNIRSYSRLALGGSLIISYLSIMAFFIIMWALRWRRMPEIASKKILLIGLLPELDLFINALQRSQINYSIVGIISDKIHDRFYTVSRIEVLGSLNDLRDVLSVYRIDEFIVAFDAVTREQIRWINLIAGENDIAIRYISSVGTFMRNGGQKRKRLARHEVKEDGESQRRGIRNRRQKRRA